MTRPPGEPVEAMAGDLPPDVLGAELADVDAGQSAAAEVSRVQQEAAESAAAVSAAAEPSGPQPLAPKVMVLWRVGILLQAVLPSALLGGGSWLVWRDNNWWAVGAAVLLPWLLCAVLAIRLPASRYAAWRYWVDTDALRLSRGVMFRVESVVPYTRIQHLDTEQGPIERTLGLSRLIIHTAAGTGESLRIPGLHPRDATALRERLALLAGVVEPL